jgi:hypothetical protein
MPKVIIDTDQPVGFFLSRLGDWITGIGETLEAEEASKVLTKKQQLWFKTHCAQDKPFLLWETPGWFDSGYGSIWKSDTEETLIRSELVSYVSDYYQTYITEAKSHPKQKVWKEALKKYNSFIEKAKNQEIKQNPAFLSMAMFFDKDPPKEIQKIIETRAYSFKLTKITGVRFEP